MLSKIKKILKDVLLNNYLVHILSHAIILFFNVFYFTKQLTESRF